MTQSNTIRMLSDSALLKRLNILAEKERATTLEILLHLTEVDRRRLYLKQGYSSLFAYCTHHLGYSESAASRRIRTARCVARYPEVRKLLAKNHVNICTVSQVAGIIDKNNSRSLMREIRGQSQRTVAAIVARYKPERALHDRVSPVAIIKPARGEMDDALNMRDTSSPQSSAQKWQEIYRRCGGKKLATAARGNTETNSGTNATRLRTGKSTADDVTAGNATADDATANDNNAVVIEQKFKLEFSVSRKFMKKLNEAKALLSNRFPKGIEFEQLFEATLDEFIDRHCPKKRQERRNKRRQKHAAGANGKNTKSTRKKLAAPAPVRTSASDKENSRRKPAAGAKTIDTKKTRTRYITPATRDKVFNRDGGKCTFIGLNGKRCNSTWGLQIDHINPHARGGANALKNLRLLCGKHNRFEAERVFGTEHMMKFARRE